jgi:hypothetical protein
VAADGGLGQAERGGGATEVALLGDGDERAQVTQLQIDP